MQDLSKFTDNSEFRTFNDPIRNIQKQNNNFKTVLKVIKLQKREREKERIKPMIYIPPQMQQMPSSNETTIRQNQNHQTIELSLPKTADYLIDSIDEISPDKAELSNIKFNQNDFNNESDHQTNSNSDDQEVQEIIEKDQSQILQQNTKQNPIQTSPEEINQSQAFADAAEQDENPKIEETQKNEVHENLAEKVSTDGKNEVYEESKEPKNNEIKEEVKKKRMIRKISQRVILKKLPLKIWLQPMIRNNSVRIKNRFMKLIKTIQNLSQPKIRRLIKKDQ